MGREEIGGEKNSGQVEVLAAFGAAAELDGRGELVAPRGAWCSLRADEAGCRSFPAQG